nr:MAG TPA: Major tail protein [Caudoviricetes sp.]
MGDIPQGDLQVIKSIFDNGVTLWHNPQTFLDYSKNNR